MNLLFIFSMPRSGSTLLQKILGAHPQIQTSSEPWLLLPGLSALSQGCAVSRYCQSDIGKALEDFCERLPNGEQDYRAALASFAEELYRKAVPSGNVIYYLDKTPRYHLFASDIIEMFPDAKFVFLWRNPLSVISSIVETWNHGRWNLHGNYIDLFDGLEGLLDAYQKHHQASYSMSYEDLVNDPNETIRNLCKYLGLDYRDEQLSEFNEVGLSGRLGDINDDRNYTGVQDQSLRSWCRTLNSAPRKRWCSAYLEKFRRVEQVGYDVDELRGQLNGLQTDFIKSMVDMIQIPFFGVLNLIGKHYVVKRLQEVRKLRRIYRWS